MTKFAAAKYDQELNKGIGTSKTSAYCLEDYSQVYMVRTSVGRKWNLKSCGSQDGSQRYGTAVLKNSNTYFSITYNNAVSSNKCWSLGEGSGTGLE